MPPSLTVQEAERRIFASADRIEPFGPWVSVALMCPLCPRQFMDRDGVRSHLRRVHKATSPRTRRQSYRTRRVKSPRSLQRTGRNK